LRTKTPNSKYDTDKQPNSRYEYLLRGLNKEVSSKKKKTNFTSNKKNSNFKEPDSVVYEDKNDKAKDLRDQLDNVINENVQLKTDLKSMEKTCRN